MGRFRQTNIILSDGNTYGDLIIRGLMFDFNSRLVEGDYDNPTFESQFMNYCTNDEGETLNPQTAHILISEFRKCMISISKTCMIRNSRFGSNIKKFIIDRKTIYIYQCHDLPIYIERVWDFMLQNHHDIYIKYGKCLVKGYIHKVNLGVQFKYRIDERSYPYFGYESIEELHKIHLNGELDFDEKNYEAEVTCEELDMVNCMIECELSKLKDYSHMSLETVKETIDLVQSVLKQSELEILNSSIFDTHILDEAAEVLFDRLISVNLPKSILQSFKVKYNLSDKQGFLIMIEYMKVGAINFLYPHKDNVVPCMIYYFYNCHRGDSFNYESFCRNLLCKDFELKCPTGLNIKTLQMKAQHSINEYKRIIGSDPPPYVWQGLIFKANPKSDKKKMNLSEGIKQYPSNFLRFSKNNS